MIWVVIALLIVIVVMYFYTQYWQVRHLEESEARLKGDIEALEIERNKHLKIINQLNIERERQSEKINNIDNANDAIDKFTSVMQKYSRKNNDYK